MNKIKILTISVIALVIVNIGLIAFLSMGSRFLHGAEKGPRNIIIKKLNFSDTQVEAYDVIIKDHRTQIERETALTGQIKKDLYSNLVPNNSVIADSLIQELGEQQKIIDQIHYNHFLELKKLCKNEQLGAFEDLTKELEGLFSKKSPSDKRK